MSFDSLFIKRSLYLCDVGEPILYANSISGSINEVSNSDKSIWLYDRATGDLLSNCILDRNTRNWKIYTDKNHDPESMFVVCRDEGGEYNGDIYDRVSLCTTEYTLPEGISSTLYWPMEHLIYTEAYPRYLHEYYNVEVPNLKGDITKAVQGTEDNKVKFVDALGNTVQNDVTANNILVNDNSVVLNSTVKNSYLKKWTPNVLGDGSEVFLSEYKNGIWCNHYDDTPISGKIVPKSGYDLCLGKFEEPAIYFGFYAGSLSVPTGVFCNISLPNTDAVSFSVWLNIAITAYYNPNGTYDQHNGMQFNIVSLRSSLDDATGFFTGIIGPVYALNATYDNVVKTSYSVDRNGYTTTAVTNSMYGGEEFRWSKNWHHVVVTRTATKVKTYMDGFLIKETTFASSQIPSELYVSLGNTFVNTGIYSNVVSGIASGLRVFNKELTQADIDVLKNDKPRIEQDIVSIKGIECAKNLIYLGGIPYNYIDTYYTDTYKETTDGITNVVKTSSLSAEDALNKITNSVPILLKDCIYINKPNRQSSYYDQSAFGLSTSPKLATDSEYVEGIIDFDTSDLEIYIRYRYIKVNYSYNILHIGNSQNSISIYRQPSGDILQLYFNTTIVCSIRLQGYNYDNTWLKLKANPAGMSLFTDNDELIGSSSTNAAMPQITSGHICVGDYRSGSTTNTSISDYYTGSIAVSDIKLIKYSTTIDQLAAEEVYKEYKFGYERDGLAGLHLLDKNNNQIIRNFDNSKDVITYFNSAYPMLPNLFQITSTGNDSVESILTNEKGFTITSYHKQIRDNLVSIGYIPYNSYSYKLGNAVYYRNYNQSGDVSPSIKIGTLPSNTPEGKRLTMLSNFDMWHSCMFVYHNDLRHSEAYADGAYNESYYGRLRTDNNTLVYVDSGSVGNTNISSSVGCVDKLKIYKTVFPEQLSRNLHQNYQEKVYKNDMQVAFIDQKYSFPLFKGIPVNSITVEGEVNGQTLTFAVTKDNNDYYICDTSWKKILTKDGNTWKYWNGSSWVAGEQEKWKAMAAAMEITANRMSLSKINSLNATQLAEFYDGTGTVFNFAVGMKSNGTKSPYIDGILINGCKLWVSPEINLADFSSTNYITKAHFKCVVSEGQTNGITLYSHVSGAAGWKKVDNFSHIPDINQNVANNGTVQFMFMFDQSKQNGKEPTALSVTIK